MNTILYCVLVIPQIFIADIYRAIGQEEAVIEYATQYVHTVLPSCYFYVLA